MYSTGTNSQNDELIDLEFSDDSLISGASLNHECLDYIKYQGRSLSQYKQFENQRGRNILIENSFC